MKKESNSGKIICVGDCHQRILAASRILEIEKGFDKCIFLGDYFDNFGDTPQDAKNMAIWLRGKMSENTNEKSENYQKFIFCVGNHDAPYRFPQNRNFYCSGFSHEKSKAINSVLTPDDWNQVEIYHVLSLQGLKNPILLSHAGISKTYAEYALKESQKNLADKVKLAKILDTHTSEAFKRAENEQFYHFLEAGQDRGGYHPYGGILWGDLRNFEPVAGLNQIFGHTPVRAPVVISKKGPRSRYEDDLFFDFSKKSNKVSFEQLNEYSSVNFDVDTHLTSYLVIDTISQTIEIKTLGFS